NADPLADWVFRTEQHFSCFLIYYRDAGGAHALRTAVEFAAVEDRDTHRTKVIVADHADFAAGSRPGRRSWAIGAIVVGAGVHALHRKKVDRAGGFHLRESADMLQRVCDHGGSPGDIAGVFVEHEHHSQREEMVRVEAQVHTVEQCQTAN